RKRAETSVFDGELGFTAFRTDFVQKDVRLFGNARTASRDFACGLALRISGARQELPESPALERHRAAAVLAWLRFGLRRSAFRGPGGFFPRELLCVLALRVRGACEEAAELPPLPHHRTAAFFTDFVGWDLLLL